MALLSINFCVTPSVAPIALAAYSSCVRSTVPSPSASMAIYKEKIYEKKSMVAKIAVFFGYNTFFSSRVTNVFTYLF